MLELHKISCGEPRKYDDMVIDKYLKQAQERAVLICDKIERYRQEL